MKQKILNLFLSLIIIILCTFIMIFSINYLEADKNVIKSSKEQKQNSGSLALMIETAPETGEYKVSTDSVWPSSGYAFNTSLSKCENGSILTYDATTNKVKVQSTKSDKCYVYFDEIVPSIANFCVDKNMASCIKTNYQLDNNINFHNSTLANGANDGSYRFSGGNPNNYVCFGPGATAAGTTCPEENQYRIIGVFGDQVKLIKKKSLGEKVWNSDVVNTWVGSTMDTYLNGEYLNSLTPTYSNKIASNTWQVGGMDYKKGAYTLPTISYNYELGVNKINTTSNAKIGLMYVSDYGFAAQPQAWTLPVGGYGDYINDYSNPTVKENNWLFEGIWEWTITRVRDNSYAFYVYSSGAVGSYVLTHCNVVRAAFYLESSIILTGGKGTQADPYRI